MKTLIILGYGKMAKALCLGLRDKYKLQICGRDFKKAKEFCDSLAKNGAEIEALNLQDSTIFLDNAEILLCVKPYALESFKFQGNAKCVYSILNAISIDALKSTINAQSYIRAMPNVCASVKQSITSICGDECAKNDALEIFSSIGECVWILEKHFPLATALGGCAPAFLALIAESLVDSGVTYGLNRVESLQIVRTLFSGFATLFSENHPTLLKESVMSPGGSTAQGIATLEKHALKHAILEAILASKNSA